jgi:predicted KAP-like P-loop ATPase
MAKQFEDANNMMTISDRDGGIKLLTDIPIETPDDDLLDFEIHSQKLAQIIRNTKPRFSVGIFGEWGSGKTS